MSFSQWALGKIVGFVWNPVACLQLPFPKLRGTLCRAGSVCGGGVQVGGHLRRQDPGAAAAYGGLAGLVPPGIHHGRQAERGRAGSIPAAAQGGPHLPRQPPGQLVHPPQDRRLRHRGMSLSLPKLPSALLSILRELPYALLLLFVLTLPWLAATFVEGQMQTMQRCMIQRRTPSLPFMVT